MFISFPLRSLLKCNIALKPFTTTTKFVPPINLIKKLREETGSPINECKLALENNEGDLEKAKEQLKAKGLAQAQKRLTKTTQEGVIGVSCSEDRQFSVIAEVNCETDFVARTDLFRNFTRVLLKNVVENRTSLNFGDVTNEEQTQKEILDFIGNYRLSPENQLNLFQNEDKSSHDLNVLDTKKLVISKLQENIKIRRILTFSTNSPGFIGSYVHNSEMSNIGVSGCLLKVDTNITNNKDKIVELGDNLAMQILGSRPKYLYRKEIPTEILEEEKNKIKKEMGKALQGKTDEIIETIIQGKLKKFYEDNVLMDMEFILEGDGGANVGEYIKNIIGNGELLLRNYHLWFLGQK